MAKQIKVSNQVYEKLSRLRQELNGSSFSYVIDELIETYERLKALNTARSILPLLDELRKTLALVDRELHTKRADENSQSIEKKSAQKGELTSYMRR
ncbi:MAG: hypothetical protein LM583_09935 [Desulfurococcaceae archaeon]|nr:hypothetical protein [Desulfurococcaceae archaeon]